jgi:hypothetical protein
MKQLITICFLLIILNSCKKSSTAVDEYYTITGVVLDYDAKTPIEGAKVYCGKGICVGNCPFPKGDSAITDVSGKVCFQYKKDDARKRLLPVKVNYIYTQSYGTDDPVNIDRTVTLYLARQCYANVLIRKTGNYLPLDSVVVRVMGDYTSELGLYSFYRNLFTDKANSPDKQFNLYAFYASPNFTKIYFQWDVIRNGSIITTKSDSTDLIQFGTKNYTLNY